MNITNITDSSDIIEGLHLDMQNENTTAKGWHYWGIVCKKDIARLQREISKGVHLWRKATFPENMDEDIE